MFPIVVREFEALKLPDKALHLAVGMFDGVHLGHQAVIESAIHSAKRNNGLTGVLTFWPHPSRLFRPDNPTRLMMRPEIKVEMLSALGVEVVIQKNFDAAFAGIRAEDFVSILKQKLPGLAALYVGENFRFGRGRVGDVPLLVKEAFNLGIETFSTARIKYNGQPISSSRIREALGAGRMDEVNALLGYTYFSCGTIVSGKQIGEKLGFPTINIAWDPEFNPCYGVYLARVWPENQSTEQSKWGVANYGVRPTMGSDEKPILEVHILDATDLQVGDTVTVEWHTFLRAERKFTSAEALKEQIARDKSTVQRLLMESKF